MAELKTKANDLDVTKFINSLVDDQKRNDCLAILKMMEVITGEKPKMWGTSIIGYGDVHLKYESGRKLDWFTIGFSPKKQSITLYVLNGGDQEYTELLTKLGKYSTGKGCLYINKLEDVNEEILSQIFKKSYIS